MLELLGHSPDLKMSLFKTGQCDRVANASCLLYFITYSLVAAIAAVESHRASSSGQTMVPVAHAGAAARYSPVRA